MVVSKINTRKLLKVKNKVSSSEGYGGGSVSLEQDLISEYSRLLMEREMSKRGEDLSEDKFLLPHFKTFQRKVGAPLVCQFRCLGSGSGSAKIWGSLDLDPRAKYQPKTAKNLPKPKSELLKKRDLKKFPRL